MMAFCIYFSYLSNMEETFMKKLLVCIALGVLFGCANTGPQMPNYTTPKGEECAAACRNDYSDCMKSDVRPDFLLFSPRKRACEKMLRECYGGCLEKDK